MGMSMYRTCYSHIKIHLLLDSMDIIHTFSVLWWPTNTYTKTYLGHTMLLGLKQSFLTTTKIQCVLESGEDKTKRTRKSCITHGINIQLHSINADANDIDAPYIWCVDHEFVGFTEPRMKSTLKGPTPEWKQIWEAHVSPQMKRNILLYLTWNDMLLSNPVSFL